MLTVEKEKLLLSRKSYCCKEKIIVVNKKLLLSEKSYCCQKKVIVARKVTVAGKKLLLHINGSSK